MASCPHAGGCLTSPPLGKASAYGSSCFLQKSSTCTFLASGPSASTTLHASASDLNEPGAASSLRSWPGSATPLAMSLISLNALLICSLSCVLIESMVLRISAILGICWYPSKCVASCTKGTDGTG